MTEGMKLTLRLKLACTETYLRLSGDRDIKKTHQLRHQA